MREYHRKRLLKLADFLEALNPDQFNIGTWVQDTDEQNCGTVCCAVGWCPKVFPKLWQWVRAENGMDETIPRLKNGTASVFTDARHFFGLSNASTEMLFLGIHYHETVSAQRVAERLRWFAKVAA